MHVLACGGACGRTLRARCAEGPESRILRTCAAASLASTATAASPRDHAALMLQKFLGNRPAVARIADQIVRASADVVEKYLAEFRAATDQFDRRDGHAAALGAVRAEGKAAVNEIPDDRFEKTRQLVKLLKLALCLWYVNIPRLISAKKMRMAYTRSGANMSATPRGSFPNASSRSIGHGGAGMYVSSMSAPRKKSSSATFLAQ